ncbi:MAG: glycosyltransferase family 2 protein [Rhodobacteraceae bacterium]|nr:glycosyltransferase family 2 protein [Paracoccaceae bacterium]
MRALAVITVRNEAAFLLEWLAHHHVVGFTDFLVFSNDCEDGTDLMLDRLAEMGLLSHVRNTRKDAGGVQWGALKQADKHPLVAQADWILPMDVDEFVNIHVGARKLADLWAALPEATAIPLTWRLFGNNGVVDFKDQPVLQQFTRAAPVPCYWPWKSAMFKTLYRNDGTYGKLGIHRPRQPDHTRLDRAQWFDGAGRKLPDSYKKQKIFSNFWKDNTTLAQLNHYPLGAKQSYVLKRDRGRAVHDAHRLGMDYWVERDFNQVEDRRILALWPQTSAFLAELKTDAVLNKLHKAACNWRNRRFDALMLEEEYRQLFGQLLLCGPTVPMTQESAERVMKYGRTAMAQNRNTK